MRDRATDRPKFFYLLYDIVLARLIDPGLLLPLFVGKSTTTARCGESVIGVQRLIDQLI